MMKVKVYVSLDIDLTEYNGPIDEAISEDIQDKLLEYLYDIEGIKVKNIRTTTE